MLPEYEDHDIQGSGHPGAQRDAPPAIQVLTEWPASPANPSICPQSSSFFFLRIVLCCMESGLRVFISAIERPGVVVMRSLEQQATKAQVASSAPGLRCIET